MSRIFETHYIIFSERTSVEDVDMKKNMVLSAISFVRLSFDGWRKKFPAR